MSTTHTSLLWIPLVTVQSSFLVASENCFRFHKGACVSFSPFHSHRQWIFFFCFRELNLLSKVSILLHCDWSRTQDTAFWRWYAEKLGASSTWCVLKGFIHSAEGCNHYPICELLYAIRLYSCLHRDKQKVKLSISQACCSSFNEEYYWLYWLAMSLECYPTSSPSSPVDSGKESHEADFM